jgi:hypothetical protein
MLSNTFLATTLLLPLTALSTPFHPGVLSRREMPAAVGTVTQFRYSGSGCTQGSNSVTRAGAGWDSQTYRFSQFEADTVNPATPTTGNCELHFQGAGLSPGWQVSIAGAEVTGALALAPGAKVNYYWQVYWSDDAAHTVSCIVSFMVLVSGYDLLFFFFGSPGHPSRLFIQQAIKKKKKKTTGRALTVGNLPPPHSSPCRAPSTTLAARTRSPTETIPSSPTWQTRSGPSASARTETLGS